MGPEPGSYAGSGGNLGQHGFPPEHGFAAQAGPQGPNPYPGPAGYPEYPGPGGPQAPYAEYQSWRPHGGYPGPGGHGEMVNGGDYAYVIREDDPAAPASSGRYGRYGRAQGTGEQAGPATSRTAGADKSADVAGTPAAAIRAITAGAAGPQWQAAANGSPETAGSAAVAAEPAPAAAAASGGAGVAEAARPAGVAASDSARGSARGKASAEIDIDPALAYGPDDPAYGPPGPDWYKRDEQPPAPRAEDGGPGKDEGDARPARGPFEPLRPGERDAVGYADYQLADDEPSLDDYDALPSGVSEYQAADDGDLPDQLDFWPPSDPEAGTLGQIKDLYLRAETISPAGLESRFDQLLERQRQLISEYFEESGGVVFAEPVLPAAPVPPDPSAGPGSLGFDTTESLAELRGELRSAP
jgi:hypothetical protein